MWKGIKTLTDFKYETTLVSKDRDLPDTLNRFFARFDKQHSGVTVERQETGPEEEGHSLLAPPDEVLREKD